MVSGRCTSWLFMFAFSAHGSKNLALQQLSDSWCNCPVLYMLGWCSVILIDAAHSAPGHTGQLCGPYIPSYWDMCKDPGRELLCKSALFTEEESMSRREY